MLPSVQSPARLTLEFRNWLESQLGLELDLPLLPDAAARIVAMCSDVDTEARDVEAVLRQDPSMAANVLRIANSSLYAPVEPIVSLRQAVNRLGLSTTRTIALSASLKGRVFQIPGYEDQVRAIWHHSVVSAAFAREIARKLRRNVEGAFLCALLHDVGRPIVLQTVLGAPESLVEKPLNLDLLESAMSEFHAAVGGRLIAAWRLADWTVAAVLHHHHPERAAPFETEARMVRLSDLLSHWALDGEARPEEFAVNDPVIGELDLYREDVDALLALRPAMLDGAKAFQ